MSDLADRAFDLIPDVQPDQVPGLSAERQAEIDQFEREFEALEQGRDSGSLELESYRKQLKELQVRVAEALKRAPIATVPRLGEVAAESANSVILSTVGEAADPNSDSSPIVPGSRDGHHSTNDSDEQTIDPLLQSR